MLRHTHWLKKIWEDTYLPFNLIPQEVAVCSCNSWQNSLNCTRGASERSSMPQGIVWFKILLCYKLQQMVVGFFEVDFYSSSTFKQLSPLLLASSSMQVSGKSVKMNKARLTFLFCSFKGKATGPSVSFFSGAGCGSLPLPEPLCCITRIREM